MSSSSNTVDPKVLARMQKEVSFIASQQRGARRIKLDKGHNIMVRFLPSRLGPDAMWYARIAKHWLNKVPITCPRLTGDDFGGDIEAECPVCLIAGELNDDRDKDISSFGWKVMANPQYLTYCLLWEKDGTKLPMDEVINPYEFLLQKSSWEELHGFYVAGSRKAPDSVLDYKKGNDFSVIRTAKGTRLDKLDTMPIFDLDDPNFQTYIDKLEKALKNPKVQMPTPAQLEAFADKVQEEAIKSHRHDDDDHRSRRRPARDEDEEPRRGRDEDDEPRSRRRDEDDEPRRGRDADEEPAPRSRRAPAEEEEPRRRAPARETDEAEPAPRRTAAREAEEEPAPRRSARAADSDDGDLGPARRSSRAADDEPAPRRAAREADEEPAPRRSARAADEEPAPRRSSRAADEDPDERQPRRREEDPEERPAGRRREPEPEPAEEAADREPEPEPAEEDPDKRGKLAPTENRQRAARGEGSAAPAREEEDEDNLPEEEKDAAPAAKALPGKNGGGEDDPPPVERKGKTADAIKDRLAKLKGRE